LTAALCSGSRAAAEAAIEASPEFKRLYTDYLDRFADRCPGELKLESLPLDQDPMPLLHMVGELARRMSHTDAITGAADPKSTAKATARERVKQALKRRPLRALLFGWVLKHARGRMRDRENLRFERMRLFGKVRHIFLQLGKRFSEAGVLDDARDIFYLETNEAWGFVDGTATCSDLKGLVAIRKAVFDSYRASAPPPGRFETVGCVPLSRWRERITRISGGEERQGLGCCAGVVRGPVHVVHDPRSARLEPGEILVAERTDPGWVILFPAAAGILVERGSLLSHAAVVTRELGIPSVVSVPGLTVWLRDGDWVQFDGATGVVTRIPAPSDLRTIRSAPLAELTHAE
jgi:pyruvate,water dikinase